MGAKTIHSHIRANRNYKKMSKRSDFQQLPWPERGKPIWDPRDPFIIAYRAAHPHVEAAWRRYGSRYRIEHKMPTSEQMAERVRNTPVEQLGTNYHG